jgi:hypothetical protein
MYPPYIPKKHSIWFHLGIDQNKNIYKIKFAIFLLVIYLLILFVLLVYKIVL